MTNKRVRVRSKRLDTLGDSKLALAIWLIGLDLVDDKTTPLPPSGADVERPDEPAKDPA